MNLSRVMSLVFAVFLVSCAPSQSRGLEDTRSDKVVRKEAPPKRETDAQPQAKRKNSLPLVETPPRLPSGEFEEIAQPIILERREESDLMPRLMAYAYSKRLLSNGGQPPEAVVSHADEQCAPNGFAIKKREEDKRNIFLVAYCKVPDPTKAYMITVEKGDKAESLLKCIEYPLPVGAKAIEEVARRPKAVDCRGREGWLRFPTSAELRGMANGPEHVFFGEEGRKTCESLATELTALFNQSPRDRLLGRPEGSQTDLSALPTVLDARITCDPEKDKVSAEKIRLYLLKQEQAANVQLKSYKDALSAGASLLILGFSCEGKVCQPSDPSQGATFCDMSKIVSAMKSGPRVPWVGYDMMATGACVSSRAPFILNASPQPASIFMEYVGAKPMGTGDYVTSDGRLFRLEQFKLVRPPNAAKGKPAK